MINPKCRDGYARIIQRTFRQFQEKEPSNAQLVWNNSPNDNTPDDEKFLDLTKHEVKNPQTQEQFNQWCTKWIELYKNNPMMHSSLLIVNIKNIIFHIIR